MTATGRVIREAAANAASRISYNNRENCGHLRSGDQRMLRPRHIPLALAVLFALLVDSWGQSQRPSQEGGEGKSQPPQAQAVPAQNQTTTDKRGTDEAPLIVKVLPSPNADEIAKRQQKEQKIRRSMTI
jgi:hypothetical protein